MTYQSKFPHGIMFHRFKNAKAQNSAKGTLTAKSLTKIINLIGRKEISPKEWIKADTEIYQIKIFVLHLMMV